MKRNGSGKRSNRSGGGPCALMLSPQDVPILSLSSLGGLVLQLVDTPSGAQVQTVYHPALADYLESAADLILSCSAEIRMWSATQLDPSPRVNLDREKCDRFANALMALMGLSAGSGSSSSANPPSPPGSTAAEPPNG